MTKIKEKEMSFDRMIAFSDAIVAIAITLLALELKLGVTETHHLVFTDLLTPWKSYLAFFLSFINIAAFWRTHHRMYGYIHKITERTVTYTICWLFFIVTLPFATSVLSTHFGDTAAVFLYSINIFALSIFQNALWNSADVGQGFIDTDKISDEERERFRMMCNLDMANGFICIILSFFMPTLAFFLLFFKIPVIFFVTFYVAHAKRIKNTS